MATKTISIPGTSAPLTFTQRFTGHKARGGGPGGAIWPCGESLALWLAEQRCGSHCDLDPEVHRALSDNSVESVLELGCGTGIVGLILSQIGVRRVVSTDGDVQSCELCAANAKRAGLPVASCQLEWGEQAGDMPQLEAALALVAREEDASDPAASDPAASHSAASQSAPRRCAEWIVGGDVVYHPQSALELEITVREAIMRGGCSLVVIGWCERGQNAESFLWRLSDLGDVRTAFRETSTKYSFMTRKQGQLLASEVEFGVSLLSVHPHITAGGADSGWRGALSSMRQGLAIRRARSASAVHDCLGRWCRTAEQVRAQDRTPARPSGEGCSLV